jgi:SAM-dependent methyltransferase
MDKMFRLQEKRQRSDRKFPKWIKERIEVYDYPLKQFVHQTAKTISPNARLLDAGAGEGQYRQEFLHTRYTGIDLAIGDSSWNYHNLDAIAELTALPFAQSTFDAVLCTQVLEHVTEPYLVLMELNRTLKPGGRLYLTGPQSWHQHQKPHDYFRYTSFGFKHLLEKSGFQVEKVSPMGGYFWFLSFQLRNFNFWVFSHRKNGRAWFTWPFRAFFGFFFELVFPLILFHLDGLDPIKDETFGYTCIGIKPQKAL